MLDIEKMKKKFEEHGHLTPDEMHELFRVAGADYWPTKDQSKGELLKPKIKVVVERDIIPWVEW